MYGPLLQLHAALAWLAIALTGLACLRTRRRSPDRQSLRTRAVALAVSLTLLLLSGLWLHLSFSAFTAFVRANPDVIWHDPTLRHWNVVHPALGTLTCAGGVGLLVLRRRVQTVPLVALLGLLAAIAGAAMHAR